MNIIRDSKAIEEVLSRGVAEILPDKKGLERLLRKRRIRLYLGIDPTASRLHLGHSIGLRKLQQFADLGHEAILVIGTGTVLAGDPSLRETARPEISEKEVAQNIKAWKEQVGKAIDLSKIKIRYNGDWLLKLKLKDILRIASKISAARLFQRSMFQRRLKKGDTVWTHEILYPLLQGYDSVFLNVDLEIGGTDQVFNMLIGRELEQKILQKEKFVLTLSMITGTDGKPMSKTSGNCIWLLDSPKEMYGKIMAMDDRLIGEYFELCTNVSLKEVKEIKRILRDKEVNPRNLKVRLAKEIVSLYHSKKEAEKAAQEFERVFKENKPPLEIPEKTITQERLSLVELLLKTGLVKSKSQAKRLITQRAIKVDGQVIKDWQEEIKTKTGMIIQRGKRSFVKIKVKK